MITTNPAGPGPFTTAPVQVTIADATPNAVIFYTTDGTNPTITSQRYIQSLNVAKDTTVIAFAAFPGYRNSDTATTVIDINLPPPNVEAPSFSPPSGEQSNTFNVAITTTTPNATVCYTSDGVTDPTCNGGVCGPGSTQYNAAAPVQVSTTDTKLRALACKSDTTSIVKSAAYTLRVAAVQAKPAPPGNFTGATDVTLTSQTQNAVIHYTTNGTAVSCANGMTATGTAVITIASSTTVKAIGCRTGFDPSVAQSFDYVVQ